MKAPWLRCSGLKHKYFEKNRKASVRPLEELAPEDSTGHRVILKSWSL